METQTQAPHPVEVVRETIGRRHRITRDEMGHLLLAMDLRPDGSTIASRMTDLDGPLVVLRRQLPVGAPLQVEQRAVADAWVDSCEHITCISVLWSGWHEGEPPELVKGWGVRFDDPGSMHPGQRAAVTFAPASLDADTIMYLRGHADRVLVVDD